MSRSGYVLSLGVTSVYMLRCRMYSVDELRVEIPLLILVIPSGMTIPLKHDVRVTLCLAPFQ